MLPDPAQSPVGLRVPAQRTQRDRHTGKPEVERAVLETIDHVNQGVGTTHDRLTVAVIAEVLLRLLQCQHHSGQPVVKRRVLIIHRRAFDQPIHCGTCEARGFHAT